VRKLTRKNAISACAGAVLLTAFAAGCGFNKFTEPFNDAPIASKNDNPAAVFSMPDGFSNFATKCADTGHRVYVVYHGDGAYGAVTVISDPKCK
jgi:hypothetical protein